VQKEKKIEMEKGTGKGILGNKKGIYI